jgi:hypothetical protein
VQLELVLHDHVAFPDGEANSPADRSLARLFATRYVYIVRHDAPSDAPCSRRANVYTVASVQRE